MKNQSKLLMAILPVLACFALLPGARAQCLDGCDSTNFNTFQGDGALINNTIGSGNAAFGWRALFLNTDGSFNTGVGAGALVFNTGSDNTAVGTAALLLNTTGADNVAVGTDALVFNDSGSENTAVGTFALENNTVDANTATGAFALEANTTGGTLETSVLGFDLGPNTAIGSHALENTVDASANTAVGYQALHSQVTGFMSPWAFKPALISQAGSATFISALSQVRSPRAAAKTTLSGLVRSSQAASFRASAVSQGPISLTWYYWTLSPASLVICPPRRSTRRRFNPWTRPVKRSSPSDQ